MRFLHTADTHTGFTAYNATTSTGVNQREIDSLDAFKQVIDYAIEIKPDFILHAGDLFHTISPNNRAISFVLHQLQRIENAQIHMYIVAGNHETPKRSETGHVFEMFNIFKYIHTSYLINDTICGIINIQKQSTQSVNIYMLPHCLHEKQVSDTIEKIQKLMNIPSDINILLTHGVTRYIDIFNKNEFNEQDLPNELLENSKFDYVALGHYHNHVDVTNIATYSGSTFPLNFGEAEDKKGFLDVTIEEGNLTKKFIEINTRPVLLFDDIDVMNKTTIEVQELIINTISQPVANSISRLRILNITPSVYKGLDFTLIRRLTTKFLHCAIQYTFLVEKSNTDENLNIGPLKTELEEFLNENVPSGSNKQIVIQKSLDYLQEALK